MARIFRKTYFYIGTGYVWGKGLNDEQHKAFNEEVKRIFTEVLNGWTCTEEAHNNVSATYTYKDGISSLYCHPQDFVGIIDVDLTDSIREAIKSSPIIKFRYDKQFDTFTEQTKEEIRAELESKKEAIIEELLSAYRTVRSNLYKTQAPLTRTCEEFAIQSVHDQNCLETDEYVFSVFKELVADGRILMVEDSRGKLYRTLNKSEMKKWEK